MKKLLSLLIVLCLIVPFSSLSEDLVFGSGTVYVRAKGGTLHLRSEPTTQSESLGIVHHGDNIDVLQLGGEWSFIFSYRVGMNGYIKTKYIVDFVCADNMFTELAIENVSSSSQTYPIPGKYHLDLDGDGTVDFVHARLFYDEYGAENFTFTFETAYGSTGEASIPFLSYDAQIAFVKPDGSNRTFIFVTGDVASSDYYTYAFYVENGHMRSLLFNPHAPFENDLFIPGKLMQIEEGIITISSVLDTLGTRPYNVLMTIENDAAVPFGSATYAAAYSLTDPELWEYGSLKTKTSVPCFMNGNPVTLEPETDIMITYLNAQEQEIGFVTKSGLSGLFKYSKSIHEAWGVDVGGIYEEDAFYFIPYAG